MVAVSDIHEFHNFFFQNNSAALNKIKIKAAIACSFLRSKRSMQKIIQKKKFKSKKKVMLKNHNNHNFEYK